MITLLALAVALSLDSFRVSLGLGSLNLSFKRHVQIVLAFGLCDGLAPLLGIIIGHSLVRLIGEWTEYLGPLGLAAYGTYVIYVARRYESSDEGQEPGGWIVLGIPLTLSLDNLIAGASLGMIGFNPLISATVIGVMSALMSLAGLFLGRAAFKKFGFKTELVGGIALICIAIMLAFENF